MMKVGGIDLGTSMKNRSTGILIAEQSNSDSSWRICRVRDHYVKTDAQHECNDRIVDVVSECAVLVIDAPLCLSSIKPWERTLIGCDVLDETMVPSPTYQIIGHAWRAHSLLQRLNVKGERKVAEVFPASWFWLSDFDSTVAWKGDATVVGRKREVFTEQLNRLRKTGITIEYECGSENKDEADALSCVLCSILIAEGAPLLRLDDTTPSVLFPPQNLWDSRLPEKVRTLGWLDGAPREMGRSDEGVHE